MDIVRNPVFIALICGGLTYMYLSWKIKTSKKSKKHKNKPKDVNLIIPLVVSVLVWFLMYGYNQYYKPNLTDINMKTNLANISNVPIKLPPDTTFKFKNDNPGMSSVSDLDPMENTFSILNGGINMPNNLPDVMLDLF